jgi:hypothetical protein
LEEKKSDISGYPWNKSIIYLIFQVTLGVGEADIWYFPCYPYCTLDEKISDMLCYPWNLRRKNLICYIALGIGRKEAEI